MTNPLGPPEEETQIEKLKGNEYLTGKLPLKIKATNKSPVGDYYIVPHKRNDRYQFHYF